MPAVHSTAMSRFVAQQAGITLQQAHDAVGAVSDFIRHVVFTRQERVTFIRLGLFFARRIAEPCGKDEHMPGLPRPGWRIGFKPSLHFGSVYDDGRGYR